MHALLMTYLLCIFIIYSYHFKSDRNSYMAEESEHRDQWDWLKANSRKFWAAARKQASHSHTRQFIDHVPMCIQLQKLKSCNARSIKFWIFKIFSNRVYWCWFESIQKWWRCDWIDHCFDLTRWRMWTVSNRVHLLSLCSIELIVV